MNWNTPENRRLVEAILVLETKSEDKAFLRDLMTESEIIEFGKRLEAAVMLFQKALYTDITKKTGLSSATVARVSKWLWGPLGGYRIALSRLNHHPQSLVRVD